jgi:hypothetical protein
MLCVRACVTRKSKEDAWWHPKQLVLKFVAALGAALAGAVLTHVFAPAVVPSFELWMYDKVGWSIRQPAFYVSSASKTVVDPGSFDPEYYRVFCGFSAAAVKYCVMHAVVPTDGVSPNKWPLDGDLHTKVVFLGDRNRPIYISWISTFSGTGGSAVLSQELGSGSFAGQGIGCDGGHSKPVSGFYGRIPVDSGSVIALNAISEKIRSYMAKSEPNSLTSSDPSCSSSPLALNFPIPPVFYSIRNSA